jgi:high-affinity Fe2+/Pb2+ permease
MIALFLVVSVFDALVIYPLLQTVFLQLFFVVTQIMLALAVALLFWVWRQLGKFF